MHYRVRIDPHAREHAVELRIERSGAAAADLALFVPTWVPGAYAFMKYARDVYDVRAEDARTGAPVAVERSGMSGFVLKGAPPAVTVRTRVTASDAAWGELVGVVAHDAALLRATHFLFDPSYEGPCRVTYEAPEGWSIHPPSGARRIDDVTFEHDGFAALLDSPVVAGTFDRLTRSIDGTTFHHVFLGRAVGFDRESPRFVDEVMAIARAARGVFGSFPFTEYTFVYASDPRASWGLEHAHATLMGIGEAVFFDPEERKAALRLAAHELFHAWNVCRLKPRALVRPDLVRGSFPDGLWLSEGFTRYYELLLATRVGALSPERFLSNVVRYDDALRALPASAHANLVDSSLATFLNHNRYPGAASATIDYYDKGMVVAFALDACLRSAKRPSSLDAAIAAFYEAHAATGFDTGEAVAFFDRFAAPLGPAMPVAELLDSVVRTAAMPDAAAWLARLGVVVERGPLPSLGLWLHRDRGPAVVDVVAGSAAARAGIGAGDEIVSAGGFAFRADALQWLVRHEPSFSMTVKSGHVQREIRVEPAPRDVALRASLPNGGDALVPWLGEAALSLKPGARLSLAHYDNFHSRESML
jgi:predicted metalloprotease with PDZ domain